jgi:hypothetical protein
LSQAYLRTRGFPRRLDYDFLGAAPSLWWSPLSASELVNIERPEVIAYGNGQSLSVLLSGLPSARQDVIGTPIRYTLVVDELREDVTEDVALARRLIVTGLSEANRTLLGRELDGTFDAAEIDGILAGSRDSSKVSSRLDSLLCSDWGVADPGHAVVAAYSGVSWAGPAGDEPSRAEFVSRVEALAAGKKGFAFTSHLLASQGGAEEAVNQLPGTSAILLVHSDLDEVVQLGKEMAEVPRRRSRHLLAGAGAAAALLLVLLTVLLIVH